MCDLFEAFGNNIIESVDSIKDHQMKVKEHHNDSNQLEIDKHLFDNDDSLNELLDKTEDEIKEILTGFNITLKDYNKKNS